MFKWFVLWLLFRPSENSKELTPEQMEASVARRKAADKDLDGVMLLTAILLLFFLIVWTVTSYLMWQGPR